MTIPYYDKLKGIRVHDGGVYYVVLDKLVVDDLQVEIWETFETVRKECMIELAIDLVLHEAVHALSPDGEETYILNFRPVIEKNSGYLL